MPGFVIQFLTQHKGHACCAVSNCGVLLFLLFAHILIFLVILHLLLNFILEIFTGSFRI